MCNRRRSHATEVSISGVAILSDHFLRLLRLRLREDVLPRVDTEKHQRHPQIPLCTSRSARPISRQMMERPLKRSIEDTPEAEEEGRSVRNALALFREGNFGSTFIEFWHKRVWISMSR